MKDVSAAKVHNTEGEIIYKIQKTPEDDPGTVEASTDFVEKSTYTIG